MVDFVCGVGTAWAQRRCGGRQLENWKDGNLTKRVSSASKSIGDKNLRKLAQGGAWKAEKRVPPCTWDFYMGINIMLSVVVQTSFLNWSTYIYATMSSLIPPPPTHTPLVPCDDLPPRAVNAVGVGRCLYRCRLLPLFTDDFVVGRCCDLPLPLL